MGKDSRFKRDYRSNASKLHRTMGDLLRENEVLKNYRIYQEYPVNRISAYFDSGREKFDWIILDLQVVIECHGQQHYKPVRFGGITKEEAVDNFRAQQQRDEAKRKAAEEAGWKYVVFKYDEDITLHSLLSKIDSHQPAYPVREESLDPGQAVVKATQDKKHEEKLAKAREYRKQRYKWWQRRRKQNEDNRRSK